MVLAVAFMALSTAMAQENNPQDKNEGRPQVMSSKERATREADRLKKELNLTDKQYKKVYKAYLNQNKEFENLRSQNGNNGQRPQGMGPGGGGQRPQGMGGQRPQGMGGQRPQGMGGQRPDGMGPQGGQRPQGMGPQSDQMKQIREKTDKKLKKILTAEQYDRYESLQAEREMRGGNRPSNAPDQRPEDAPRPEN